LILGDTSGWGLFRPFYHLYGLVVYPLGADLAHGLRLLMFIAILAAPLVTVLRQVQSNAVKWLSVVWLLALSLSAYSLLYGVYLVSLQELTGMFLVALGLLSLNTAWRGAFWLLAAWTKAPFVWLYLAFGVKLLSGPRKRLATITLLLGALSFAIMAWAALNGAYTQGALNPSPWHLWMNVQNLGSYGAAFLVIAIVGLLVLLPNLRITPDALVFFVGTGLYAANLLPWNAIGYYNAPVWYLLICGFSLTVRAKQSVAVSKAALQIRGLLLGACLIAGAFLSAETIRTDVIGKNTMIVQARDWVLNDLKPNENYLLYELTEYEFDFFLRAKDPNWARPTPIRWFVNKPQPPETEGYQYVIANTEYPIPDEIRNCPAIKVWTRGFLAPLNC
jgi:hypothetical protein